MVSANPASGDGGGGGIGAVSAGYFAEEQQQQAMALPGTMGSLTATSAAAGSSSEDPNKKIRKPYTITKSRESWTEQEHDKFLEALQLFDRDWKKIEAFVGSKSVIQIRSHAQKYFLKVQKNGTSEHVPPPRPKRKAAHPYPQKASKNAPLISQPATAFQASSCLLEPGYAPRTDSSSVLRNSSASGTMSSWAHSSVHPRSAHMTKENIGPAGAMVANNCCSSTGSPPGTWPACETNDQGNHVPSLRVMPDFSQVYSFIGSVFDPSTSGHLQKLKEMDPIDVETVLLLMRNLSINLTSPDFEDHEFAVNNKVMAMSHREAARKLHAWRKNFDKALKRIASFAYELDSSWDPGINSIFDKDDVPRSTLCVLIELLSFTADPSWRPVPLPPPWSRRDVLMLSRPPL